MYSFNSVPLGDAGFLAQHPDLLKDPMFSSEGLKRQLLCHLVFKNLVKVELAWLIAAFWANVFLKNSVKTLCWRTRTHNWQIVFVGGKASVSQMAYMVYLKQVFPFCFEEASVCLVAQKALRCDITGGVPIPLPVTVTGGGTTIGY